jgi:hypothetical protein
MGTHQVTPGLEAGQLWRIESGYVHIVELGQELIRYQIVRQPQQRAAPTRSIGLEALLNYLQQSDAELVRAVER